MPDSTGFGTATDNCDSAPVMTFNDATVSGSCAQQYTINRTWIATDACGNSSTCNQVIFIQDTLPPVITCPADITIQCFDNTLPANTGNPVATDNCDSAPAVVYNDITMSGPAPGGYTIQRTWTTTDACNNSSTCLQIITLENPVDPEITGFEFDTICSGQSVIFTAEDPGNGPATYDWNFGSGSMPVSASGIGPHTVSYTYDPTNGSGGAEVFLTVTVDGCAAVTDTVANVHVNAIPDPTIEASTANLCYFRLRTFKPLQPEMGGFTYEWNFGSGASIPEITGYGPHQVKYSTTGLKTITLIVFSNEAGASCGDTATIIINVVSCPGNITGRVRKPDGTGIGGVNVRLFNDANLDGMSDGGAPVRSVFTTTAGTYSMVGVVPAQYVLVQTDLPNFYSLYDIDETNDFDTIVFSDPNDNIIPLTLEPQEIDADNVFVDVTSPGIINGYVFEDFNSSGLPDAGEGIAGVTIKLFTDNDQNGVADTNTPIDTTVTSAIGFFTFGNVANADYVITEVQPTGYQSVEDIDLTEDNDVVPNTNTMNDTIPVTINNGETDSHNFFKESSICSNVVTNTNDDGAGSLRYILDCTSSGGTITFHSTLADQIIHLTSDRIVINKNINIHSTLSPRIRIQSDISGAFQINAGYTVEFKNINFTSGLSGHLGAAFENYGDLILWDVNIFKNNLLLPGNYLLFNGPAAMTTAKGNVQIDFD